MLPKNPDPSILNGRPDIRVSTLSQKGQGDSGSTFVNWVVVKIMVPFWVPIIIRHLIFRVPKTGP